MGCDSFEDGDTQFTRAEDENGEVGGGHDLWKRRAEAEMGTPCGKIQGASAVRVIQHLIELAKRRALLTYISLHIGGADRDISQHYLRFEK